MKTLFKILSFSMALAAVVVFAPRSYAQLHVDSQGEVGIGTTSPGSKLEVQATSSFRTVYLNNNYIGSATKYGIYNLLSQNGTGSRYGLYNFVRGNSNSNGHFGIYNRNIFKNSGAGFGLYNYGSCDQGNGARYGIYNVLECVDGCGSGNKYALYSSVNGGCGSNSWAGYFNGNVYVSGTITQTSDASRKTNVRPLSGALEVITRLDAKTYDYVSDGDLNLPTEKQYGFIAQELQEVLPEIVKEVDVIASEDFKEDEEAQSMVKGQIKSVNYQALIPILVKGMQEQQLVIDAQQKRIELLEAKINR